MSMRAGSSAHGCDRGLDHNFMVGSIYFAGFAKFCGRADADVRSVVSYKPYFRQSKNRYLLRVIYWSGVVVRASPNFSWGQIVHIVHISQPASPTCQPDMPGTKKDGN